MSSQRSVTLLRINRRRSRLLTGFILTTHGGALVLSLISLPLWAGLLLSAGVMTSLVHTLNRHVLLRGPNAFVELNWDGEGNWTLLDRDGKTHRARLLRSTYLHVSLVILNFEVNRRNHSVILLPDAIDKDTLRRLRVRLNIEKHQDTSPDFH